MREVRALLVLVAITGVAAAETEARLAGDNALVCQDGCDCVLIDPTTGAVVRGGDVSDATDVADGDSPIPAQPDVRESPALAKCGAPCKQLRARLAKREHVIGAVDKAGKRLFEIEDGFPTMGSTWSLVTGKRLARFSLDDFGGPPPPVDLDHVAFVGRHVVAGERPDYYTIDYDSIDGMHGVMFQATPIAHDLVVVVDGFGRVDLQDFTQRNGNLVAHRRVKSHRREEETMIAKTLVFGEKALVVSEYPSATLLVDTVHRTISKPRALPKCD